MPYLDVTVYTPTRRRSRRVRVKVDTGFSGSILLGIRDYLELGLQLYELSEKPQALIAGGYRVDLRAAWGFVEFNGVVAQCIIYTLPFARRSLIGRELLNRFRLTLDGRSGAVELEV
ncbi:MAG: hypothetical protein DRK00_06365 [Thermoprotei archaeon]|nr:MAG: hypothetical protein DRK00_06365 [Thermoprotei archaeon]